MADVFDRLAVKLHEVVRTEHANSGSGAERFKVVSTDPLRLDQLGGSIELEEGDPDVTIGAWVRQLMLVHPLEVGDEVWCLREGMEWHVLDITDPGGQIPWAT